MRQATRMMMLGNRAARNVNGQNYQNGDFAGMTNRATSGGMTHRATGSRAYNGMGRRDAKPEGRYAGQYGNDDLYEQDDEDYGSSGSPQRMYAAGMAWTDPSFGKKGGHDNKRYGSEEHKEIDEECAMKWVRKMKAADGTAMPKWRPEQVEQLRKAHCPECKEWEYFVAMNMMYADYGDVAKRMNTNKDEFYALMAKAFLMDEDAGPHKLARYMEEIPKK